MTKQQTNKLVGVRTKERSKIVIPTFLKWAGGKKQLLEQFSKHFPEDIENYVEPFLGGGAVLFYVLKYKKPKKAYAYDINADLINVFLSVRDNPKKLIHYLNQFQDEHNTSKNQNEYYKDRKIEYNTLLKDKVRKAALFIYLNKTCFNGLYRVNSIGEFNVPFGKYTKANIFDEKNLLEASALLQGVVIKVASFDQIVFPQKSVAYFDPPYWSENNGFTNYHKTDFGRAEQQKLHDLFVNLDRKKHQVILSNSNTSFIKSFYKDFNNFEVNARWMINCNGEDRGIIKELLITNIDKKR